MRSVLDCWPSHSRARYINDSQRDDREDHQVVDPVEEPDPTGAPAVEHAFAREDAEDRGEKHAYRRGGVAEPVSDPRPQRGYRDRMAFTLRARADPRSSWTSRVVTASATVSPVPAGDPCSFLTARPKAPTSVLNEPGCYHFRALDPGVSLSRAVTRALAAIRDCYHN